MIGRQHFTYLLKRSAVGVLGLLGIIWLLVVSVDLIEAMREVGLVEGAGMPEAIKMTLFRTPQIILTVLPFVFLFGTLWAFGQMAKSSEIAVMRAAGLSVWRVVAAPVTLALVAGILTVTAIDPLASNLASKAQAIKNEIRGKDLNLLKPFREGIWLRQTTPRSAAIIRAAAYDPKNQTLTDVVVWRHSLDGVFIERWDADKAEVTPNVFYLKNARRSTLHGANEGVQEEEAFPVTIDLRALREDIAKPEALSVWQLPDFSNVMRSAGMSTIDYDMRYHDLWSLPVKLAAMVLIGCAFSLRISPRSGGTARLVGAGIGVGFVFFILSELSAAVAAQNAIPVGLATWTPALIGLLFALGMLLYREDG